MQINAKKTTSMVFNYTDNYQFSTRLLLNNEKIENVRSTKLLGTIISDDLSWELNTLNIVTKANARMQLARKVANFGAPEEDIKMCIFCLSGVCWNNRQQFGTAASLRKTIKV